MLLPSAFHGRTGRISGGFIIVLAVLAGAFSNEFGRAEPTGRYRPELPPRTLDLPCFPLPDGARLDELEAVVRWDGDVTIDGVPRRRMVLHYLETDLAGARETIVAAFTAAGFTVVPVPRPQPDHVTLTDAGGDYVVVDLAAFDVPEETVVKGEATLDLPVQQLASDDPWCANWYATKRFPGADDA